MVGEHLQVLTVYVISGNTVGFGTTGREMVIGGKELNGRDLLERVVAPVLIEVNDGQFLSLACLDDHRYASFAITDITPREEGFLKFVGEVLGYLKRHREHHVVLIQNRSTFKAGGEGISENVDVSVSVVSRDGEGDLAMSVGMIIEG